MRNPSDDAPAEAAPPADTSRRIAGAVGVQLLGRVTGIAASVVTVALTTRHLGVGGYGLLTTAVVFVALWSSLTELGISAVIVRKASTAPGDLARLVGVNLGLSVLYCVPLGVVAAVTGLLLYRHETSVHVVLLVVCTGLLPTAIASCFNPVFMATVRFGPVALADAACRMASLAATLVVIGLDGGLVWFGAVQVVPPLLQIVVYAVAVRRIVAVRVRFDLRAGLALLRESLPQTGVLIIGVLYWRADAVILTVLSTTRQVGAYGFATTMAFTLTVLGTFYLGSSLSTMTERYATDRPGFTRFVGNGVEAMLFVGAPVAVIGAVLARPVIALVGGSSFASVATVPMALLLVSVALTFLTGVLSQAMFAAHDQVFLLRLNVANLAVNIVLNIVLAPHFGAVGAASALLVSEVTGLVITTWRLGRTCGYRSPWGFLLRLLPSIAVAAALAVLLHGIPVLLAGAAAAAGYLAVNLVTGPVRLSVVRGLLGRGEVAA